MNAIPFSVYDFFAYLSSGGVVVGAVDVVFGQRWLTTATPTVPMLAMAVVLAYLTGHVIAELSAGLLEDGLVGRVLGRPVTVLLGPAASGPRVWLFHTYYRPLPEDTKRRIRERVEQSIDRDDAEKSEGVFYRAFAVVSRDPASKGRLDEFRTQYGFARNMCLATLAAAAIVAVGNLAGSQHVNWGWAVVGTLFSAVLLRRYLKFHSLYSRNLLLMFSVSKD